MTPTIFALAASLAISAAPAPEPISLASDEWSGSPIQWSIQPDGSIVYTRDPRNLIVTLPMQMVTRRSGPEPDRYRQIARLLEPARKHAGTALPCKQFVTEGQKGVVRWGGGVSMRYDNGCLDAGAKPVVQSILAAQRQIAAWMKDAPVVETHDVTTTEEVRRYDP